MRSANPRILSCGEVLWDLFPDGARFGGAPANFACHAALLGGKVSMLSAVGEDARGREAIGILQGFEIDTSLILKSGEARTGSVGVSVDAAGKPSFDIQADSAWDRVGWTPALETQLTVLDAVYFGTLGQRSDLSRATIQRILSAAKSRGILRVLDVNLRPPFFDASLILESIRLASVLKLSEDELLEVARACGIRVEKNHESVLQELRESYRLDLVALTLGAEGALLVSANETVRQPGIPTEVRDTVGAGDAFTAALVVGLLRGESLETLARSACATAAAVCAHVGAVPLASR